jgi:hypothetical protein
MAAGDNEPDLSAFQMEVARLFFALSASRGFLLVGRAALLAQHLTARPTEDLDFFTSPRAWACPSRTQCSGGRSARPRLVRPAGLRQRHVLLARAARSTRASTSACSLT